MHEEVGGIIDRTLREATALQEQLGAKRLVLSFLRDACFETWPPSSATKPIENFLSARAYPLEDGRSPSHPALAPWRLAQEAFAPTPTPRCRLDRNGARLAQAARPPSLSQALRGPPVSRVVRR